ncbi:MAG: hypothetical protein OXE96_10185 [Gemmatimonadetes bacterium]|nr:hypothetical protein [Gemmatimonadota bacterium]
MHRIVLVLILLPTTLPAAAQTTVGVRAGLGSAKMAVPGTVDFAPCPPETDCPSSATDPVRGLTFGADFDIPIFGPGGVFGLRFGAAYVEKGGAGSGYDAKGEPDSGTISTSYVQFSMLLRARTSGPQSVVILFGPWAGAQLSCEKEGDVAANCGGGDAGVTMGAGVEIALPGGAGRSVGIEGIYYRGLTGHSQYDETTRLVAVQVGFVFPVG